MSAFAKVENGIVTQVILAEQNIIDSGILGDPSNWIQTCMNTRNNIHYGSNNQPDGGIALRGNYACIGYIYDKENDVFYPPQPYPFFKLNKEKWGWEEPFDLPIEKDFPLNTSKGYRDKAWSEEKFTYICIYKPEDLSLPDEIYFWNNETQNWDKEV